MGHHDMKAATSSGDELSHEDIIIRDKEVHFRQLAWSGFWLMVIMFASLFSMWWMIDVMKQSVIDRDPPEPAMAQEMRDLPVRGPKLQEFPPTLDIEALHAWEHEQLSSYGTADENEGTVRIPIDDAMEILSQRGLPRHGAADAASAEIFGGGAVAVRAPEGDEGPSEGGAS